MLVFLSHSGSDTDAARALKKRIAAAPAAREAGLELWLDVDELRPGDEWQPALEAALERADAFMVYVGAKGVVNWVDRELRHAMTRATGPNAIPFVPVLASDDLEPSILPPFVRQFQAVTDPLGDDRALAALVCVLVSGTRPEVAPTDRPFVGLAAMDEAEADRFFGRDTEIAQLTALLKRQPLVAVVADSGAGKSSLVRAGLVPAFRGGALLPDSELASPAPRHVVVMRPGADPVQGLKDGVDRAARALPGAAIRHGRCVLARWRNAICCGSRWPHLHVSRRVARPPGRPRADGRGRGSRYPDPGRVAGRCASGRGAA